MDDSVSTVEVVGQFRQRNVLERPGYPIFKPIPRSCGGERLPVDLVHAGSITATIRGDSHICGRADHPGGRVPGCH